jgi:hypothetical protein
MNDMYVLLVIVIFLTGYTKIFLRSLQKIFRFRPLNSLQFYINFRDVKWIQNNQFEKERSIRLKAEE